MNEKPKNDKPRINRLSFFLLWIVLGAGAAAISHNIFLWLLRWIEQFMGAAFIRESLWRVTLLDALLLMIVLAPVEKLLLKFGFGQWVKGWISSRFLSLVLTVMPYILLQNFGLQSLVMNNLQNILQLSIFALITALPQVWVLRRYVQNSWQYLFAALISSLIPVGLVTSLAGTTFGASFTIGSSAAVMALTILWLFSHPINEEKTKRAEAQSFERLEDGIAETHNFEEEEQLHENQLDR
jgi:hypothetical protein